MSRVLLVFVIASSACLVVDAELAADEHDQAIVGGVSALGFPGVVLIGGCTGTLIGPRLVLTAAHCSIAPGDTATVTNVDQPVSVHSVIAVHNHRRFTNPEAVGPADVAVAFLDGDPMVEPHPFPIEPLEGLNGAEVVSVGFGANTLSPFMGFGTKRTARFVLDFANDEYLIGEGTMGEVICFGDSGGPAFLEQDDELLVIGIASRTSGGCRSDSGWTNVATYVPEFIIPAIDSFEGPCRFNGTCVTTGCRTPDPDCAPCGLDGVCSSGCEVVDLDCPPKSGFASPCTVDDDCESLLCVDAPEGGRLCSASCSATEPCQNETECIDSPDGGVCLPPQPPIEEGGCGCSTAPSRPGWLALILLLAFGLATTRRPAGRAR